MVLSVQKNKTHLRPIITITSYYVYDEFNNYSSGINQLSYLDWYIDVVWKYMKNMSFMYTKKYKTKKYLELSKQKSWLVV